MKKSFMFYLSVLLFLLTISILAQESPDQELKKLKNEVQELRSVIKEQRVYFEAQLQDMQRKISALTDKKNELYSNNNSEKLSSTGDDELKALRLAAANEITHTDIISTDLEEKSFKSGGLSLQSLNPELSVVGELIGSYNFGDAVDNDYYDWNYRGLGLHFAAYLDPYSRFKAAIPISSEGAELGEAYFTRYGVLKNTNITLGKFRQQFGIINRWHKHALDFYDFPLPVQMIFGAGGLNQTGMSIDYSNSFEQVSQEITVQITNGDNLIVNSGNSEKRPNLLLHYKNYRDLTPSTYLELGLTGMMAWNDKWNILQDSKNFTMSKSLLTKIYGIDCTVRWEPTDRMRYRNSEFRTELYLSQKDILAYDGTGSDTLDAFGWYASLNTKINRTIDIGMHIDYYKPDNKSYATLADFPYTSYAVESENAHMWLTSLYLTWFQSPFVKYHLEYNHEDRDDVSESEDKMMFQVLFAAGPYKHERY